MARLTGLDGVFLALESPTTHLHIMGTMVLDPSTVPGGLTFGAVRSVVADRVHLVIDSEVNDWLLAALQSAVPGDADDSC